MDETVDIVEYNPVGEAGFPDVICPVLFVRGCNLRCPFCLNAKLVTGNPPAKLGWNEAVGKVKADNYDSVLISGGEPCSDHNLADLVDFLTSSGLKVRLSTNGCFPASLENLLLYHGVSFVAMDIKTSLHPDNESRYNMLGMTSMDAARASFSISLLADAIRRGTGVEFRTTLYPHVVYLDDLEWIRDRIPKGAKWVLQQYRARKNLLGGQRAESVPPYPDQLVENWAEKLRAGGLDIGIRWP